MLDRIKQILRSTDLNLNGNVSVFAKAIGMEQTTVNNYILGKRKISSEFILNILNAYPQISAEWLLRGEGEMFNAQMIKADEYTKLYNPKYTEKRSDDNIINLYDIDAAANLKTLFANKEQYASGKIMIPNASKCDGALYVKGESMYPLLKSGDIVAYKEITPDTDNILWGEMYLVDLCVGGDDYLVVKYVQKSEKGDDWVKLVSHNKEYQPKDFHASCIRAIALIKLCIRMNTTK